MVEVLYLLRIMNSGRRKCFKYIKQIVCCSHVSRSGWHFRPSIGILLLYLNKDGILGSCLISHEMQKCLYVLEKLGLGIQIFFGIIFVLFCFVFASVWNPYGILFLWRITFFPSRACLKRAGKRFTFLCMTVGYWSLNNEWKIVRDLFKTSEVLLP